jgi:hypothetical protein
MNYHLLSHKIKYKIKILNLFSNSILIMYSNFLSAFFFFFLFLVHFYPYQFIQQSTHIRKRYCAVFFLLSFSTKNEKHSFFFFMFVCMCRIFKIGKKGKVYFHLIFMTNNFCLLVMIIFLFSFALKYFNAKTG